jgi:predicted nucleic acid-binding protein
VRFWDSSAIVPLLVAEPVSTEVMSEYERDPEMLVWWGTEVECVSALARLEREGSLPGTSTTDAVRRLTAMAQAWREVEPIGRVRQTAVRLLRVHALQAGDALQLAAALAAAEDHPDTLPFVTLDERLAQAAEREGFPIVLGAIQSA